MLIRNCKSYFKKNWGEKAKLDSDNVTIYASKVVIETFAF